MTDRAIFFVVCGTLLGFLAGVACTAAEVDTTCSRGFVMAQATQSGGPATIGCGGDVRRIMKLTFGIPLG